MPCTHGCRIAGDEVLRAPREFPQFGEHYYATYLLDPHGFRLEVVCLTAFEAEREL